LEHLDNNVDIRKTWESNKWNIKAKDSKLLQKHYKPWFDSECLKLLGQRVHTKLQCLQNSSHIIGDNLDNVRCEGSRIFR